MTTTLTSKYVFRTYSIILQEFQFEEKRIVIATVPKNSKNKNDLNFPQYGTAFKYVSSIVSFNFDENRTIIQSKNKLRQRNVHEQFEAAFTNSISILQYTTVV